MKEVVECIGETRDFFVKGVVVHSPRPASMRNVVPSIGTSGRELLKLTLGERNWQIPETLHDSQFERHLMSVRKLSLQPFPIITGLSQLFKNTSNTSPAFDHMCRILWISEPFPVQ